MKVNGGIVTGVPTRDELRDEWKEEAESILAQEKEHGSFPEEFKRVMEQIASGKVPGE